MLVLQKIIKIIRSFLHLIKFHIMPQWFSTAPKTLLIATTPLRGYSDIETISWIYFKKIECVEMIEFEIKIKKINKITYGWSAWSMLPLAIAPNTNIIGTSSGKLAAKWLGLYRSPVCDMPYCIESFFSCIKSFSCTKK